MSCFVLLPEITCAIIVFMELLFFVRWKCNSYCVTSHCMLTVLFVRIGHVYSKYIDLENVDGKTPCTEIICKTCTALKANTSESHQWQTHLAWCCVLNYSVLHSLLQVLLVRLAELLHMSDNLCTFGFFCTGAMNSDSAKIVQFEVLFSQNNLSRVLGPYSWKILVLRVTKL